jgi:hypothetical protein
MHLQVYYAEHKYSSKTYLHLPNNAEYKFSNVSKNCKSPGSLSLYHNGCQDRATDNHEKQQIW